MGVGSPAGGRRRFRPRRCDEADGFEQAAVGAPADPGEGGVLDGLQRPPSHLAADDLGP